MSAETETLYVMDTTATPAYPTRTHEHLIDGVPTQFTFAVGQKLPLSIDKALKFLKDPAFIVTDADGKRYDPTPKEPTGAAAVELAPNELIARIDELSTDALVIRAKQINGGEGFKKQDGREKIIAFLIEKTAATRANEAARAVPTQAPGSGNIETEDMGEDEVGKMFEDA
jgi:hypothetical protein